MDNYYEALDSYLKKDKEEKPEVKFVNTAHEHLKGIAKAKVAGDDKAMNKRHEELDAVIHGYAGKRKGE